MILLEGLLILGSMVAAGFLLYLGFMFLARGLAASGPEDWKKKYETPTRILPSNSLAGVVEDPTEKIMRGEPCHLCNYRPTVVYRGSAWDTGYMSLSGKVTDRCKICMYNSCYVHMKDDVCKCCWESGKYPQL